MLFITKLYRRFLLFFAYSYFYHSWNQIIVACQTFIISYQLALFCSVPFSKIHISQYTRFMLRNSYVKFKQINGGETSNLRLPIKCILHERKHVNKQPHSIRYNISTHAFLLSLRYTLCRPTDGNKIYKMYVYI